jgi:photosystem II stability/assembly factor-like uncharacterized protein
MQTTLNINKITIILTMFIVQTAPCKGSWEFIYPTTPEASFNDVYWTGERLFAVGEHGTIITSTDGIQWSSVNSGTDYPLTSITGNGKILVAVGDTGMIITSVDGKNWVRRNAFRMNMLYDVIWTGTEFVISGNLSCILTSSDGITWAAHNVYPITGNFHSVAWNGFKIAAVESTYTTLSTSTDLDNWEQKDLGGYQGLIHIAWLNNSFIAVGGDYYYRSSGSYYKPRIDMTINDSTWTSRSLTFTGVLNDVCWTGSNYVSVGWDNKSGQDHPVSLVATSSDGVVWTAQKYIGTVRLSGVTWTGKFLVAVGWNGCIIRSTDEGVTWEHPTSLTLNGLSDIVWGINTFVAIGDSGTIVSSNDGRDWVQRHSGTKFGLRSITYGKNRFVAVGDSGTIAVSLDGISWMVSRPMIYRNLASISWGGKPGNEKYVACGGNNYLLSLGFPIYFSSDGITWDSSFVDAKKYMPNVVTAIDERFIAFKSMISCNSDDGVSWNCKSEPEHINCICYDGRQYYRSIGIPNTSFQRSTDGLVWSTFLSTGQYNFYDINYGNNNFVAVGFLRNNVDFQNYRSGLAIADGSGNTWKLETIDAAPELSAAAWGNGKCVAVGLQGTIMLYEAPSVNISSQKTNLSKNNFSFSISNKYCNYNIDKDAKVKISLYDILGRFVCTLINENQTAGKHKISLPNSIVHGRYILEFKSDTYVQKKSIVILR